MATCLKYISPEVEATALFYSNFQSFIYTKCTELYRRECKSMCLSAKEGYHACLIADHKFIGVIQPNTKKASQRHKNNMN